MFISKTTEDGMDNYTFKCTQCQSNYTISIPENSPLGNVDSVLTNPEGRNFCSKECESEFDKLQQSNTALNDVVAKAIGS